MTSIFKSIFISLFPVIGLLTLLKSILFFYRNGFSLEYLGVLVASCGIVLLFVGLFIVKRARTKKYLPVYSFIILGGILTTLISGVIGKNLSTAMSLSLMLLAGWLAYLFWYSRFPERSREILAPGNTLPELVMEDPNGVSVSSKSFIGYPAIYIFYRGNWCPLCMAQIKEVVNQYKALERRKVITNFISPQPHSYSKSLAKKYGLKFNFLTDVENQAARKLGIHAKHGIPAGFQVLGYASETVLPTVIITDKKGSILYADLTENYRIRPEPGHFIQVLDS